jgi:hypothetical protein
MHRRNDLFLHRSFLMHNRNGLFLHRLHNTLLSLSHQACFAFSVLRTITTGMAQYADGQRLRRRPNIGAVGVGHGPGSL